MALSVATLAGFPAVNTTFQRSAGTPTDAATFTYTSGVYTQVGTQYVAGILDQQGQVPSRIFFADNNTGGGTGGTQVLPTLVSVTQVSNHGQSIQSLPSTTFEATGALGYGGFIVVITPAEPSMDSGGTPKGWSGGPTGSNALTSTLIQVPGYTTASPNAGYPQPQIRYYVSINAMLLLASTSTG